MFFCFMVKYIVGKEQEFFLIVLKEVNFFENYMRSIAMAKKVTLNGSTIEQ